MSKWLVVSYDEIYGGNKEDWACLTGSYNDAYNLGCQLSIQIIYMSSEIFNALRYKASRRYPVNKMAYEKYLIELINKDIVFEIYQLSDDAPINLFDYDNDNWELILRDYEVKNVPA